MKNYFLPEIVRIFALDNSQKRLILRAIKAERADREEGEPDELVHLKKSNVEQIGNFVCSHFSMVFETRVQLTLHHGLHYLF